MLNLSFNFDNYNKIFLAFSGGVDSTVLLDLLIKDNLKNKINLIHVHHGISLQADSWVQHAEKISAIYNVPLYVHYLEYNHVSGVENWARTERYKIFDTYLKNNPNSVLLTAHHADDQVETVLMNIFRGSGMNGLSGMLKKKQGFISGDLLRPLLFTKKSEIQDYALKNQLIWVEDDTNQHMCINRNFIRHQIIPDLTKRWPKATNNILNVSLHAKTINNLLHDLAVIDCPNIWDQENELETDNLEKLPKDRIFNVIAVWLMKHNVQFQNAKTIYRIVDELIFSRIDAHPLIAWGNYEIRKYRKKIYLLSNLDDDNSHVVYFYDINWDNFPDPLEYAPQKYINIEDFIITKKNFLDHKVYVGFRKPKDKMLYKNINKKMSKIFQEWGVEPWKRGSCLLLFSDKTELLGYKILRC